ncbi:MAG: LacI family transcriptional regulator [Spirochaetales bacterium]|nr:LacI family transcriptional regulator [Spirochaetales bacterium]
MKTRLIDVAEAAGVSVATASQALNGKGRISPARRTRVIEVAARLGYQPNIHAASISASRITHVAVLIVEDYEKAFEWYFIRRILIGLESILSENKIYPIIVPVRLDAPADRVVARIIAAGAGAVVSVHYGSEQVFRMVTDRGIPLVAVNNDGFSGTYPTVTSDDVQGAFLGTAHLLELGCREVGFIDYGKTDIPTVLNDRFAGFRKAIEATGVAPDDSLVCRVRLNDRDGIRESVVRLIRSRPDIDGLFVHDDYLAAQIIDALRYAGKRVPADISIVAPGDTLDYSLPFVPRVTTMQTDTDEMGRMAARAVLAKVIGNASFPETLRIGQRLVERESCRARIAYTQKIESGDDDE